MGSAHKKDSLAVSYFSHPHQLEHTTASSAGTIIIRCFGCNLRLTNGEVIYKCKTCNFFLHHDCYDMPLVTNHPSHPNHNLVLLVIPKYSSSPAATTLLHCMACRNHLIGFCYHCAECNIFFHPRCVTLPLFLSTTCHSHKIKLEYSPPYDFFCDFCNKPSYKGWLYRCNMCEFDIHITCAIENMKKNSSLPQSNAFLLRQQIGMGSIISTSGENMKIVEVELQEKTPLRDKMTALSSDDHMSSSTPPSSSYQFSDSCFSIDLTKSYSTHRNLTEEEESIGVVNWPLRNTARYQKKLNAGGIFKGGSTSDLEESNQRVVMKIPKDQSLAKWSIKEPTIIKSAEKEPNNSSRWRKLLTCCF